MPAFTVVPVFPVSGLDRPPVPKRPQTAIIQGNIHPFRRDYVAIFESLEAQLRADPKAWGWKIAEEDGGDVFVVDPDCPDPFKLILLGALWEGEVFFPKQLHNVVQILGDPEYTGYYSEISKADMLLPAFARPQYFRRFSLVAVTRV